MLMITYSSSFLQFLKRKKDYLFGFIIHFLSYLLSLTIKRGGLYFQPEDRYFIVLIMGVSLFFALILEKYNSKREMPSLVLKLQNYFTSFLLSLGVISIIINIGFPQNASRLVVFGSLFLSFVAEICILFVRGKLQLDGNLNLKIEFSILNFLTELAILIVSYLLVLFIIKDYLPPFGDIPFIYSAGLVVWFIVSVLIHKFKSIKVKPNFWLYIWTRIKAYILFVCVYSFILFAYHLDNNIQFHMFLVTVVYSINAIAIFTILYILNHPLKNEEQRGSLKSIGEYKENIVLVAGELEEKYNAPNKNYFNPYLSEQLINVYLKKFPGIFEFMDNSLDLLTFDFRKCVMNRSSDIYNVEILPENYLELYLNLHQINDIPRINEYFHKVNQRLELGGYFIGRVEPTHLRFERFLQNYPYHIARFFYFIDFFWRRVTPNLPVIRKLYYLLSNGKKRAISFPEALGRLYYCGFEVCNYEPNENYIYFICRKVKESESIGNPLYGPLIKLKRIGKNGKAFNVYKFRTMHPYSEFIQKYIFDKNNLESGGKIKNDFRVTSWGRILRKFWLDELPMFINLAKGNLKLVGVRPLSAHYLSLYSDELRELRFKYKPGIFPPFYYDMPKTLVEIMNSEQNYLEAYEKSPYLTDIKYFFVILFNILFKKARSK